MKPSITSWHKQGKPVRELFVWSNPVWPDIFHPRSSQPLESSSLSKAGPCSWIFCLNFNLRNTGFVANTVNHCQPSDLATEKLEVLNIWESRGNFRCNFCWKSKSFSLQNQIDTNSFTAINTWSLLRSLRNNKCFKLTFWLADEPVASFWLANSSFRVSRVA